MNFDSDQPRSARALTRAAHAAFVPIGVVTVLLGPMLPILSARWGMNYTQAGSLFTVQFITSSLGVVLSGWLVSRRGFRFAIGAGLLFMAAGVAALPFSSHVLGMACIAAYGFGLGVSIPASNLVVAETNSSRRSAALNLLNFSWSVGAVACPFLVGAADKAHHVAGLLMAVAATLLAVSLGISAMPRSIVEPAAARNSEVKATIDWTGRQVIVMSALFFLYVGTENSFGGWIASYARSLKGNDEAFAVMTPSFFYTALLLGRWAAPLVLRRVGDLALARAGLLLACVGMAGMVFSRTLLHVVASGSVAGLGLAAVYPITISMLSVEFGAGVVKVGSVVFTMSNFGGALLPWLVGFFSERAGKLQAGLTVPLIGGMVVLALYVWNWNARSERSRATVSP